MPLTELIKLCPPPAVPVEPFRENRLEEIRHLYGLALPQEYVACGHTYGTGAFVGEDDHGILIHNPFSSYYHKHVADDLEVASIFFRDAKGARTLLEQNNVDQARLFPLGRDTDVTYMYWVTDPDLSRWRILLIFGEWENWLEVLDCGLCAFLAGYFASGLKVKTWQYREINGRPPRYHFRDANSTD